MEPLRDNASSTFDSGSSQFQQPSEIRQEHRGKFISKESASCETPKDVRAKLHSIREGFSAIQGQLQVVQEAVWWRTCSSKDLKKYATTLTSLSKPIAEKAERLYGFIGLHRVIPAIKEIQAIPDILAEAKKLEIELVLAQKTIKRLKSLCECKAFRSLYDQYKLHTRSLVELVSGSSEHKIDLLKAQIAKVQALSLGLPNEKRKVRAMKALYLEMCELSLIAAEKLAVVGVGVLNAEIRDLTASIADIKLQLNPIDQKRPSISGEVQLQQVDVTWLDDGWDKKYGFFSKAPTAAWASYTLPRLGWYKQTGDLGLKMERDVGQRVGRLLGLLEQRLSDFCQGNIDPIEGKRTLQEEIACYAASYYRLKNLLAQRCNELQAQAFDALTQTLLDYAHGLHEALVCARSHLMLLQKCLASPAFGVLKAMRANASYYSVVSEEQTLERALALFPVAKEMQQKAQEAKLAEVPPRKPFEAFLKRSVDLLHEVHANKDPQILMVTAEEQSAADAILSHGIVGIQDRVMLPEAVMAFVVKRMQQALFLPCETHDVELELVLHQLRTCAKVEPLYQQSLKGQHTFRSVVDAYEAYYAHERFGLINVLAPAAQIVRLALTCSGVQGYAQAWQQLIEYARGVPKEVFGVFRSFLLAKLKWQAEKNSYPFLYPSIQEPDIETWKVDDLIAFGRQVNEASEQIRPLSVVDSSYNAVGNALVFRIVSGALYAKDVYEQVMLQKKLNTLLCSESHRELVVGLSEDVKQLICENAIKKIGLSQFDMRLSYLERSLLEQGPFEQFFANSLALEESSSIGHVLYKLIRAEAQKSEHDRPIADNFKERMGIDDFEFDRWFAGYDILLKSTF